MAENRPDEKTSGVDEGRRRLIKAMGLAAGGLAASALVPDSGSSPACSVGTLPRPGPDLGRVGHRRPAGHGNLGQ